MIQGSRFYEQLNYVKVLEIFEDNDLDEFQELLKLPNKEILKILKMKNTDGLTPLHISCFHGYKKLTIELINLHRLFSLTLDGFDDQGNTPLSLLASHGYLDLNLDLIDIDSKEQMQNFQQLQKEKSEILQQFFLQDSKLKIDIKKSIKILQNTPLHWCIYYGDYHFGKQIFDLYPMIILKKNEKGLTPLEMIIHNNVKPFAVNGTKKLCFYILKNFVMSLFKQSQKLTTDLYKNAQWSEKRFIRQVISQLNTKSFVQFNFNTQMEKEMRARESRIVINQNDNTNDILNKLNIEDEQYEKEAIQNDTLSQSMFMQIKKKKLMVFNAEISDNQNQILVFLHQLLIVACYLNSMTLLELFLTKIHLNPFYQVLNKYSAFIFSCEKNLTWIVQYIFSFNYIDQNNWDLPVKRLISQIGGINKNSALHFVIQNRNVALYQLLKDNGADLLIKNYFDLIPYDMTYDSFFKQESIEFFNQYENKIILDSIQDPRIDETFNEDLMKQINQTYTFLLITHSVEENYKETLMYDQLQNLQKRFKTIDNLYLENNMNKSVQDFNQQEENVMIRYIKPMVHVQDKIYRHYFLVQFSDNLIKTFATILRLKKYNNKLGYSEEYSIKNEKDFNWFRDFHVHKIYMYLFNIEFKVNDLIRKGIIESIFPLHEFRTRNNILISFRKERSSFLFDPFKAKIKQKDMRPFNSIAFYFGCELALYVSFVVTMTSYLLILSIIGIAVFVLKYTIYSKYGKFLDIIYAFFVIIWLLLIYVQFRQRENAHAYYWNTQYFQNNDIVQDNYQGFFSISQTSYRVKKTNNFKTIYRWFILEVPLGLIAVAVVLFVFYAVIYFTNKVNDLNLDPSYVFQSLSHDNSILFWTIIIGLGNGAAIVVFTEIYILLCQFVVYLENHKFQRTENNSYVVLNYIFYFFINYLNLLYYAVYLQDYNLLASNYITIIISKNFLFVLKNNFLPHIIYLIQKHIFIKKYRQTRQEEKRFQFQQTCDQIIIQEFLDWYQIQLQFDEKLFYQRDQQQILLITEESQRQIGEVLTQEKQQLLIEQIKNSQLNSLPFFSLSEKEQQIFLTLEKSFIQQDQVELTNIMTQPPQQNFLWVELATQMGFIAFFSVSYPIFTIYGYFISVIHIFLLFHQMTSIYKRQIANEWANIGLWKAIFKLMIYLALIINTCIILFTIKQDDISFEYIQKKMQEWGIANTQLGKFIAFILFEHLLIIIINFILNLTNKQPKWLQLIYKIEQYKKDVDVQIQKSEEVRNEINRIQKEEQSFSDKNLSNSQILNQISSKQEIQDFILRKKTNAFLLNNLK